MGYRSTFISEHVDCEIPDWFIGKWVLEVHFFQNSLIASAYELSLCDGKHLFEDYQKALIKGGVFKNQKVNTPICVVVMGEDQAITKVKIYRDKIEYMWMEESHDMGEVFNHST